MSAGSELKWERYRGDALSFNHRPPYDHTTRTQLVCLKYIFVYLKSIKCIFFLGSISSITY
jgi:hypothetical protein